MEKNSNNFGLGLFFGIAIGVLAGILVAPSTGEETRRKIIDSTDELHNSIKTISKKIKTETDEMIKKGKHFIQEAENSALDKIHSNEDSTVSDADVQKTENVENKED